MKTRKQIIKKLVSMMTEQEHYDFTSNTGLDYEEALVERDTKDLREELSFKIEMGE